MSNLNVLYQFNEKYAPYAGVSITSLLENNTSFETINIYVLGEELSDNSVQKLEKLAQKYSRNIIFKDTKDIICQMKNIGIPAYRGSYAANIRLFCPLFIDDSVDRLVYLDADTLVTEPLEKLIGQDLNGKALGMALDSLGHKHKLAIGLKENEYYYNSGVILFDLKCWIKYDLSDKIVEYVKRFGCPFSAPDQDLLNIVCKEYIQKLSPVYNMQPVHLAFTNRNYYGCYSDKGYYAEKELSSATDKVCIYHTFRFLGEFPWHENNLHPSKSLFNQYLSISPWADYEKRNAEMSLAMSIEKILYIVLPQRVFLLLFKFFHGLYVESNAEVSK